MFETDLGTKLSLYVLCRDSTTAFGQARCNCAKNVSCSCFVGEDMLLYAVLDVCGVVGVCISLAVGVCEVVGVCGVLGKVLAVSVLRFFDAEVKSISRIRWNFW